MAAARGGAVRLHHEGGPHKVFGTRIPKPLHRALKSHCVTVGTAVMDLWRTGLEEKLAHSTGTSARRRGTKA
jgi:hypothetical protein